MPSQPAAARALRAALAAAVPAVAAVAAVGAVGAVPALAGQALTRVDRERLAAAVWSEARYNYAWWDRVKSDWDSAFAATLAAADERQPDWVWWKRLRAFVALLDDGQADVIPPPAVLSHLARPPIMIRAVQGRPFIVDYADNAELRIARPQRLAEITAVQGIPVATWIRDSVLPFTPGSTPDQRWARAAAWMLLGERGTAVHLQLRLPGGEERGASVTRTETLDARWPLDPPSVEVDTLPDSVCVVRLNDFSDPGVVKEFDRAFRTFRGVRGLIVDLRENALSAAGRDNAYRILARLVTTPFVTSRWRARVYRPAYRGADMPDSGGAWLEGPPDTIAPRTDLPAFTGPVAVLSSSRTAGPAEDFLVAFRNAGRGPIVGGTSAGSTGLPLEIPIGFKWTLRLCVTRDAFPNGAEFARTGIAPELPVEETVPDFLAGRDAALERARGYIRGAPAAR